MHSNKIYSSTSSSTMVVGIYCLAYKEEALFQKAKRTNLTLHHEQYRCIRNKITNMIRAAKRNYLTNLNTFSNKDFWKAFKAFNKDSCSIPALENNGIEASSDIDKAELLNFFSTCWNTSTPPLDSIINNCNRSIDISISDILFTEEEVCQSLKQLNTTKATGPDGISSHMLKLQLPLDLLSLNYSINVFANNHSPTNGNMQMLFHFERILN